MGLVSPDPPAASSLWNGQSPDTAEHTTQTKTHHNVVVRPDLVALAARLPPKPLTRFAPSPTYYLHLGHVVNAIYVWGMARALGGRVLLRIEDHDRTRCRAEYDAAILDDLAWLGLEPDADARSAGGAARTRIVWRQSDHGERYAATCAELARTHGIYACRCSRQTIATAGDGADAAGVEARYPGTCRPVRRERADIAVPPPEPGVGLRVVMPSGREIFDDALMGLQAQDPSAQCGDVLLRDRHGCWTYQFSVTVDDWRDGVDLVIRGRDLLPSTGRQIALARMLGRDTPPVFLHHALVVKPDGEKVSKSSRDTGVRDLRAAGLTAADVLGRAAHACGLIEAARPLAAGDLAGLFDQPPRSPRP